MACWDSGAIRRGAACRRDRPRGLPRLVLEDFRARAPGGLGAGPARRTREAGAGPGVVHAVPAVVQPGGGLGVPGRARLARSGQAFRELYRERRDAMLEALDEQHARRRAVDEYRAAGSTSGSPCPRGLDAKAMLPRAVTARVAYVPGTAFYADGFGSRCMRLSYCHPTPERIREGVRRLAARDRRGAGAARRRSAPADPRRLGTARRPTDVDPTPGPDVSRPGCLVLAGGLSHERDVSLRSGRRVAEALRRRRASRSRSATSAPTCCRRCATDPPPCVLPLLHGEAGEDGALREVLELVGVPYVGAAPAACRLAYDKPVAKAVVARAGLRTPTSVALPAETFREIGAAAVMDAAARAAGAPAGGQAGARRLGPGLLGGPRAGRARRRDGRLLLVRPDGTGRAFRRPAPRSR